MIVIIIDYISACLVSVFLGPGKEIMYRDIAS